MTTASDAAEMLGLYIQAEKDVLAGKQVRFGDRMLTTEDLAEIRAGRREWELKLAATASETRYKPLQVML